MATLYYLNKEELSVTRWAAITSRDATPSRDEVRKVDSGVSGSPGEIFKKASNTVSDRHGDVASDDRSPNVGDVIEYDDRVVMIDKVGVTELDW